MPKDLRELRRRARIRQKIQILGQTNVRDYSDFEAKLAISLRIPAIEALLRALQSKKDTFSSLVQVYRDLPQALIEGKKIIEVLKDIAGYYHFSQKKSRERQALFIRDWYRTEKIKNNTARILRCAERAKVALEGFNLHDFVRYVDTAERYILKLKEASEFLQEHGIPMSKWHEKNLKIFGKVSMDPPKKVLPPDVNISAWEEMLKEDTFPTLGTLEGLEDGDAKDDAEVLTLAQKLDLARSKWREEDGDDRDS